MAISCARETLKGVLDAVVAETMTDMTTEDGVFGGALTDPVIEVFVSRVVHRLKAHAARYQASAVGAPAALPAEPSHCNSACIDSDARTALARTASCLDSCACTTQMDQTMVWQHVLRFRRTHSIRCAAPHLAAVSPQVRRLAEADAVPSPALSDLPARLWWLCRQPTVALHVSDAALANGTLMSLLAQLPGRLALTVKSKPTSPSLAHLQGLTQLHNIDLSRCKWITDAGLAHLQGLTQLEALNMSSCERITDAGLAHLQCLTQLEALNMSCSWRITDAGLAHLQGLTQLRSLDLSYSERITDAGLEHLQRLTQLKELNLSACKLITDVGLAHLQRLSHLQTLNLSSCWLITDAGVAYLQGLTHFRIVR